MPVPQGDITSSQIWATPAAEPQLEDVQLPEESKELTEEEKLEIALKLHKGEL